MGNIYLNLDIKNIHFVNFQRTQEIYKIFTMKKEQTGFFQPAPFVAWLGDISL